MLATFAARRPSLCRLSAIVTLTAVLGGCESKPPAPGQAEFSAANNKITVYESQVGFGNGDAATKAATTFSKRLKALDADNFSGGKEMGTVTTSGHWLSYCQATAAGATFLVRVPNLETYTGDNRELLVDLAWQAANEAAAGLKPSPPKVTVGIRGKLLYGGYASGARGDKPAKRKTGTSVEMAPFYSGFVAK
jgi:hypothetical protein